MFDRFHKKPKWKGKPGLLSEILSPSPRRDVLLFGGVADPVRGAWTRPHGGYKTKEQVDRDVVRCQEYIDAHKPQYTGPFGRVSAGRQRQRVSQQAQPDPSPVGADPEPPAPGLPPASVEAGGSVEGVENELGTEAEGPHRAPEAEHNAGSVLAVPGGGPGAGSAAGSIADGRQRGSQAGSNAGSVLGELPQLPGAMRPEPTSNAGSQRRRPRRPRRPASNAGRARRPQGLRSNNEDGREEVELFDETTTVEGGNDHARPHYAPQLMLYSEPRQNIAELNERRWLAESNPNILAARRRLAERNAGTHSAAGRNYSLSGDLRR